MKNDLSTNKPSAPVAIIGLSGRFPGAEDIDKFWELIKNGSRSISFYSREELLEKGVDPKILDHPDYVPADSIIESADKFDSSFFGYTPREADFMDPQHRVFLEASYAALENAGYDPERFNGDIGVFAGCSRNNYWLKNLSRHFDILRSIGELQTIVNNDKDFLTTRVSYKLNLTGPSVDVQTACSTSLTAIHFACQSLVTGQSDMAIGGGVFVKVPRGEGYVFEEGSIDSPKGICRPFDKEADGTVFGEGVGVVVLKRLEDAVRDHDTIHAVIKSTAINNDGSQKVGYMAPAIEGQSRVIAKAQKMADIDPGTIGYIETHGTGTNLGDPIETAALQKVFGDNPERKNYCALGSVKANIGHLDTAAGVAGVIKAALVLKNKKLPPLTNFRELNPELHLEESPFYINTEFRDWKNDDGTPRRAAVSSFGIGGTNAHAILEEYQQQPSGPSSNRFHLLPLSAKTPGALEQMKNNLLRHLSGTQVNIADAAFTLQNGRKQFRNRGLLIVDNLSRDKDDIPWFTGSQKHTGPQTVFMFTGQGSQYINMAAGLYKEFDSVKTIIDYASAILREYHNINLPDILFPQKDDEESRQQINETSITQPALYVIQYAVAHLLGEFGIRPDALTGHSIGELTAAAFAGVFSFEDGLNIVAHRGRLMQAQKTGVMLSVNLPMEDVIPLTNEEASIALNNAPDFCVVSGSADAIEDFDERLHEKFPECRTTRLKTSHAFHSKHMEPALEPFREILENIEFSEPQIPFISNVTGTWITKKEAVSPAYWTKHIRSMVNFSKGIEEIMKNENTILFEVGPGNALAMLLSRFRFRNAANVIQTVRHPRQKADDKEVFFKSVATYWNTGGNPDWELLYDGETRYRIPLPSYPFERRRHWIDPKVPYSYYETSGVTATEQSAEAPGLSASVAADDSSGTKHQRPDLDSAYVAAQGEREQSVVAIWEDMLGIKGVGMDDDFFDLGGHSLLAAQIVNRINDKFSLSLPVEILFETPTIRQLLDHDSFTGKEPAAGETPHAEVPEGEKSLSYEQERLWLINQIDGDNPAYNIPFTFILKGKLDKKLFTKSLNILFSRHEILKSTYGPVEGEPKCFIHPEWEVELTQHDFSRLNGKDQDVKIQEFIRDDSRENFDLQKGPLYRLHLADLGKEQFLFHMTVHHLVFDGWSWGIFTGELKEIYNDLAEGKEVHLPEPELQYYEYTRKQKAIDFSKYDKSTAFWREALRDAPEAIKFPWDHQRKNIPSGQGRREPLILDASMTEKLRKLARKENSTLYMTLLSALGLLLHRYSGDDDICIGSPTANRPDSKLEKVIGLFINTIVLRLRFSDSQSFSKLLQETRKTSLNAIAHQDLPFEKLVDILQPNRTLNVNPFFQVMFAWQNTPRPPLDMKGIQPERVVQHEGISPLDITLYAWEENGKIEGEFEYSTDLLNEDTIKRLKDNFIGLLNEITDDPGKPLADYNLLSETDKEILGKFNDTKKEFPSVAVHTLFEQQVQKRAGNFALSSKGERLTYRDLDQRSDQLAGYLVSKGLQPGDVAGVSLERTPEMLISVLAIWKAGAAYLPMDPVFPAERLLYMIEDARAPMLITSSSMSGNFTGMKSKTVVLDEEAEEIRSFRTEKTGIHVDPRSLAYLIYTSGSTGKPKGVKVHHEAVVNFLNSMATEPGIVPEDRLLAVTTLSFDISVLELFLPLTRGAEVVMAGTEEASDGDKLRSLTENHDITILQATPATWNLLLSVGWKGKSDLKALCGGEAMPPSLAEQLLNKVESLWNMYGPTETTVWSACHKISNSQPPILVGKPVDNTFIHIMNGGSVMPAGAIGEVCIGGKGVSKGYHNREKLTAEKFIDTADGQKIYRTGDLGRIRSDGNLELFGRMDSQIKLRGYRIEPGEIENLLSKIFGVQEAVVKVQNFGVNDDRLVAFLHVDEDFDLTDEEVINVLDPKLPAYMIPGIFRFMAEFPRTPNGKIDKKALLVEKEELVGSGGEDKPSTPAEKSIAGIWQDLLGIKDPGVSDDFFRLGGHSLLASQAITRINRYFGSELPLRTIFESPTIRELSKRLNNKVKKAREDKNLEVHLTELEKLPLTAEQKKLWIFCKLNKDNPSYNIPFTYRLHGKVDEGVFDESMRMLFERHHVLFSVFGQENGDPFCSIDRNKRVSVTKKDLSHLPGKEREEKLEAFAVGDARQTFDLEKGPLYRLFLLKLGDEEYVFHGNIHHLIFDGWSWGLFIKELNHIYNSLIREKDPELNEPEFQAYDYAWYREHSDRKEEEEKNKEFWKEYLSGSNTITGFPWDKPRKEKTTGFGGREYIAIPEEFTSQLKDLSEEEKVSLFVTMLSAFGILMQKYSNEHDINIGTPVANRPFPELEKVMGMFVNTVVMRMQLENVRSLKDLIRINNESVFRVIAHQDLPFEKIVEAVKPERTPSVSPLFQVSFVWQNNLNNPIRLEGARGERIIFGKSISPFDLTFYMWENGNIIEGEIEYNTDILGKETVQRLRDNFLSLISRLVREPGRDFREIPVISHTELDLLESYNDTSANYPSDKTLMQLFSEKVKEFSGKKAVVYRNQSLTYKELDEKSNRLANTLRDKKAGREEPVALLMEKSPEFITGIFAILKAGGCYVPIDPDYPDERIRFMLDDAGCRLVLTKSRLGKKDTGSTEKIFLDLEDAYSSSGERPEEINTSRDLAYIMYTSGTTGLPKGSMIQQNSVTRLVRNSNYVPFGPDDRFLSTGAVVFDAITFEFWSSLLNGLTLYLADKETLLRPQALGELLLDNEITVLFLTPALFTQIAEIRTDIFRKLKYLFFGGDTLSVDHINKVRLDNPQLMMNNGYGPTENTVCSTHYFIDREFEHTIPIGRPLTNNRVYVFDDYLNPVPMGVTGELYLGGEGVSRGYLNREDLNKVAFVEHPSKPGERLYRSGDLVRWLPDGNLEFMGRKDTQLKIRGFRVEPAEIEAVISSLKNVVETIVKPLRLDGDIRLVAFLHVNEHFDKSAKEMFSLLSEKLPGYMVPSGYKMMREFPKTINGKIDRKALVFNAEDLIDDQQAELKGLTDTEQRIYSIWKDILKNGNLSLDDNFFESGGNSLLAISLINKIEEEFGNTFSFAELIKNPDIRSIAALLGESRSKKERLNLVHTPEKSDLPLSANQRRMWLNNRMNPDIPSYIITFTYHLKGELDQAVFTESIKELFSRHDILFARIKEDEGEPLCEIVPSAPELSKLDFSHLSEQEKHEELRNFINEESVRTFNLRKGPLYRLFLIKGGEKEYYFHLTVHHIIFDGWSIKIFNEELSSIYNALLEGQEISPVKPGLQQYDYALWEKEHSAGRIDETSLRYWESKLSDAPSVLNFPFDHPRKKEPGGLGGRVGIQLPAEVSSRLREFSRKADASLFATMLGSFGLFIQKYTGEKDFCIGSPMAHRPDSKLEEMIGMFVNTLVFRMQFEKDTDFAGLVKRTQEDVLEAFNHQEVPFETIVDIVKPERSLNMNPVFQVVFAWQNNLTRGLDLSGVESRRIAGEEGSSPFDLSFYMWENGDKIEGEIEYNRELLNKGTVERIRKHYITLLTKLSEDFTAELKKLSLVTPEDINLLNSFTDTAREYPSDKTIIGLFREQVEKYPDNIALVFKDQAYSYAELDKISNRLAHTLRKAGVKREDPVGLFIDKSAEMITGTLAILKAGGAYLPIDPDYPAERQRFMLNDSGCKIMLIQDKYLNTETGNIRKININDPSSYHRDDSLPESVNDSHDLAYIMYTSGTTGTPKGSMIQQNSVVRLVRNTNYIDLGPEDRILLTGAIVFDATTFEIWGALLNGGRLYVVEKDTILQPQALGEELLRNEITTLWITSPLFTQLAEVRTDIFSGLKYMCTGGEVVSYRHFNKVRRDNPKLNLLHVYGPTENTTYSTYLLVDRYYDKPIPIGKPISNSTAYIFDENMNYVPVGVSGELLLGGEGVSRGYLNREDLNKTKFVNHPFTGERLYRSGDKARWLPDGNIEFLGRLDNQLKIRGFRVELEEIESVINKLEDVVESVVKPFKLDEGDTRLVAFLNVRKSSSMNVARVNDVLREKLPSYMMPSAIKIMQGFPKNINGKTDKKALTFDIGELAAESSAEKEKMTPLEERVHKIWSDILKSKNIGTSDNFFEIGGNSLLAISVISKIESEFDIELPLRVFFDSPRIKDLSEKIEVTKVKASSENEVNVSNNEDVNIIKGEI